MNFENIKFRYIAYAEDAIIICAPDQIDEIVLDSLLLYRNKIEYYLHKSIIEVVLSYSSLLVYYKYTIDNFYNEILLLKNVLLLSDTLVMPKKRLWQIPVCYSERMVPGLRAFVKLKSLTVEDIISLHTQSVYTLFFIGFLPGFMYLGGLHKQLHTPRKPNPDLNVEGGSVAIGGSQTGIYPGPSPGGWHVIGKSPLSFFNPGKDKACFVKAGDKIKFVSIDEDKYNEISLLVREQVFEPKSEIFNG